MSKKAVYSNKGLQVYITGEDFVEMLENGGTLIDLTIVKNTSVFGQVILSLTTTAQYSLGRAFEVEQRAIDQARNAAFNKPSKTLQGKDFP